MSFIHQLWEILNKLGEIVVANADPLNFIGMIVAALVAALWAHTPSIFSIKQRQYEELISPLFEILEPVLYQKPDQCIWNRAFQVIEENKLLVDGKLRGIYYECRKKQNQENFIELCFYVDKAFDRCCSALHIKKRSMGYRLNRRQYKNKKIFARHMLFYISAHLVFLLFLGILLGVVSYLLNNLAEVTFWHLLMLLALTVFSYIAIQDHL